MQVEKNVVISEFIVNMEDVLYHRDNTDVNIAEKVAEQTASLAHYGVAHYVLTNAANQQDSDNLHIVQTDLFEHYPKLTLYFYRILMAFDFLQAHPEIEEAALTDAGDVKMLNYPFDAVEDGILYMGDETIFIYDTSILIGYDGPQFIKDFIWENGHLPILNLGIMVGTRETLIEYLGIMVKLITEAELSLAQGNDEAFIGTYEMAISNYVAYYYFKDRLVHGNQVSTIFHGEQTVSGAWFKHK